MNKLLMQLTRGLCAYVGLVAFMVFGAANAHAATPLAGTRITSQATVEYVPSGFTQTERVTSGIVEARILAVEAIQLKDNRVVPRPVGTPTAIAHQLINVGNVASTFTFSLANQSAVQCAGDNADISNLSLVRDSNSDGIAASGEPVIPLGVSGQLRLAPGESVNLLVTGTTPNQSGALACVLLSATTDATAISATNQDQITTTSNAVLTLTKSADRGNGVAAGDNVRYTMLAHNIGASPALPSSTLADGSNMRVDGVSTAMVLFRDVLPTGTEYVEASLGTTTLGATKLYRWSGDPAYSYRTNGDDRSRVIEVAIGFTQPIAPNVSIQWGFSVKVKPNPPISILNNAEVEYSNGTFASKEVSNPVTIFSSIDKLGLALSAGTPTFNLNASGTSDGTLTFPVSVRIKAYGWHKLYNLQVGNPLEGTTMFGSYTSSAIPGAGQYTIVSGSIATAAIDSNSSASINSAYTGQAGAKGNLLAAGAQLGVAGDITVTFLARVNITGRADTIYLQATGQGTLSSNGTGTLTDLSQNGTEPDPDFDGDPTNNNDPTPVILGRPILHMTKTALAPVQVSGHRDQYVVKYKISITNSGAVPATYVRVADNLNCTFPKVSSGGSFVSWSLIGAPVATKGLLKVSSRYTGDVACDMQKLANTDAVAAFPTEIALILNDGTQSLAPGTTEEFELNVLATIHSSFIGTPVSVTNKAYGAALQSNQVNALQNQASSITAATSVSVAALLIDPSGTVYNSVTRDPVEAAMVTLKRVSCSSSSAGPITAAELVNGNLQAYTYNADGSVTLQTNSAGQYYFVFKSPPVTDLCQYQLSVAPPSGSALTFPSASIPAKPGVFGACGSVVANSTPPAQGEPTTYYLALQSGVKSNGTTCEVFANHIPIDPPGITNDLTLKKSASKSEVELIDFVTYTLDLTNNATTALTGFKITDRLPNGFAYVPGSAALNAVPVPDPEGGQGPSLMFNLAQLQLDSGASASLRYRVRVGVGSTLGVATNRATAASGLHRSLEARASVKVTGGVFAEEAFLFGKVYLRCTPGETDAAAPGQETKAEWGVPGVRLLLQNGTSVVTDSEGKWSLYGLKPQTQVIKIDPLTLPAGARAVPLDNRNAGQGDSRFADLRKGEWHKANFVLEGCDKPEVVADVLARRKASETAPAAQDDAAGFKQRLNAQSQPSAASDLNFQRALPTSGSVQAGQSVGSAAAPVSPILDLPAKLTLSAAPVEKAASSGFVSISQPTQLMEDLGPKVSAAISSIPLEELLPDLPKGTRFIELKDNDTLVSRITNVRVQGPIASTLELKVNGVVVSERRVGKRTLLESTGVAAWEYIGVELVAGTNRLELTALDSFGIARGNATISVRAPGDLARIEVTVPDGLRANPAVAVPVTVKLTDENGVPVTARTPVTLQTDRGTWITPDLNPKEPGLQQFIEGGQATFQLTPPSEPGETPLHITVNALEQSRSLRFLPDLRPLVGIGIVEGTLDLRGNGTLPLGAPRSRESFEREIQGWSTSSDDGNTTAAARLAFFFKGEIKGEYLLTAAFDSEKTTRDQMFRDIQPDRYYPIYGDSSVKGFDAQSTGRLFVRVDKDRSYAVLGDFTTASSGEVRKVTQTSRGLSGLKHVYETDQTRATSFLSRDTLRQQIVEIPANGTSGPYSVNYNGDLVEGSERVEILVRDRRQPGVILTTTRLAAFTDYSFDTVAKRIILRNPLGSVDNDLNPQSIRVTVETDAGGESFWVAGTDAQFKVNDKLQLGVVATQEDDPTHKRTLAGVTALAKVGENTVIAAEVGRTNTDKVDTDGSTRINADGEATRLELRHEGKDSRFQLQSTKVGAGYDNLSAGATAGSSELLGTGEYKLNGTTRLKGEVRSSKDEINSVNRLGSSVSMETQIATATKLEVGVRTMHEENGSAAAASSAGSATQVADQTTLRGRITTQPGDSPSTRVYGEYEQDIKDTERKVVAVGGDYQLTEKTRAYGRYELLSSLANRYSLGSSENSSVAMLGLENNFAGSGRAFNEYRIADTINGREAQNALGVRDTYKLADNLRLGAGFEQVNASGKSSTAVTGSVEYEPSKQLRTSASLELRYADAGNSTLNTLAAAYKIDSDWSLLARSTIFVQSGTVGSPDKLAARQQVGFAYRPVNDDTWNFLGRYEHRIEDGLDSTDSRNRTHIASLLVHQQPQKRLAVSSRLAFKSADLQAYGVRSTDTAGLVFNRVTYDLDSQWDIGSQVGVLFDPHGASKTAFGIELGRQIKDGLWASVGYNWSGLRDPALTAGDYTDSGIYIRLRFKFDERGLQ